MYMGDVMSEHIHCALRFYKFIILFAEFDLEKEKSILDEQGLKIAENQENSQKNRRKLAESTRDFKKAPTEEKLNMFNSLLKGYQEEVDNLTKRAKFGENAFLNIYQKLYEAPDPYPALASIAEQDFQISDLESENRKMKVELEDYRTEATHLKNQQATIRRLEDRNRQLEQQMEEKVKEIVEIKQRSLAEDNQKTLEVLKEREEQLQDQLRQAKDSVSTMQKLHELAQSQLFEVRAQSEEERAAKQTEVNLLMDEAERAQTRLFSLEREKVLTKTESPNPADEWTFYALYYSIWNRIMECIANRCSVTGLLRSQLQSTNDENDDKKRFGEERDKMWIYVMAKYWDERGLETRGVKVTYGCCAVMGVGNDFRFDSSDNWDSNSILENSLSAKEKIISELNTELHNMETTLSNEREQHIKEIKKLNAILNERDVAIEEIKKELQARPTTKLVDDLRKKVKILQAVGYNSIEAEDWELATSGEEMSKLESLLLDKNRKMEHELTQLKVKLSEKTSLLEATQGKVSELNAKVNEQQKLIAKLEDDILKGYNSIDRKGTLFNDWDLQEVGATEITENADQKHVSSEQDQSSMLRVICNQRDRFRNRLRETEEETRLLKEKIGALSVELEKTKADNVKLYGKIRYVQDYNLEKLVSRGSKKHAEDIESGFSSDVESKYKKIYEDDINPFAAFSKKERDQRYRELGFRDKITLSSGRFLLGNKYARTFVFFYSIGLHLLVFSCLYRMSAYSYLSTTNVHEN
ncbi:hypothetical protein GIB67_036837 [Kingdonia uniflora]|uniref:Protein CASP n=1 Tax=Kingdonia uniflora TaxID=39325 RepID=A0A7J7LX46_9MAGN|nr:hypothetical protein GIB67_036837 [Kingdonia uniflora]